MADAFVHDPLPSDKKECAVPLGCGDWEAQHTSWKMDQGGQRLTLTVVLTPPPPRISLPADVGAVIGYVNRSGEQRRAIHNPRGWDVYGLTGWVVMNATRERMTELVENGTGYEVIVPGFPPLASSVKDSVDAIVAKIARTGTAGGGLL